MKKLFQNILFYSPKAGLFLLVALWLMNCSTPVTLEEERLVLINSTSMPLAYGIMELETSRRAFIAPQFAISIDNKVLQPNNTTTVFKKDITVDSRFKPIEDITINLWEVVGDSAFIRTGITLTHEELEQWEFQVQIKTSEEDTLVAGPEGG